MKTDSGDDYRILNILTIEMYTLHVYVELYLKGVSKVTCAYIFKYYI